jgi:hypothetical protein
MSDALPSFAQKIAETTAAVFGDSLLTQAVNEACQRYANDVNNIMAGRGIQAQLIAIVGAKGQGKTWSAKQFVRDPHVQSLLRSGDLLDDATTRLVWIGPVAPDGLEPDVEIYHPCSVGQMAPLGRKYVILDTPGMTDVDQRAVQLASQAMSLASLKLLVIARDQLRAAANMTIAHQIDGSVCVPVITAVEPSEMPDGEHATRLAEDIRTLRIQLEVMAPRSKIMQEVLVPDFEITGDEEAAGRLFMSAFSERFAELGRGDVTLENAREQRVKAARQRLRDEVSKLVADERPQVASAVDQLHRETEHLPERVIDALLGSETVLATGIRMRLRARLVSDTPLLWFPYRTMMSTLNLTQGAWDRVVLTLAGSVPSLFGALTSWAQNAKAGRVFSSEVNDGIRRRTQQQVEERLRPLCDQFHRSLMKLRPRGERTLQETSSAEMNLSGIEELQTRSQQIFDEALDQHATGRGWVQLFAVLGVALFWMFMAGPIVLIYREYFMASYDVFTGGNESRLEDFPHPTPSLLFTALLLSLLPLAIYCMVVLTLALSQRKVARVAKQIVDAHQRAVDELKTSRVIRLEFQDQLLQQAEFLLKLD